MSGEDDGGTDEDGTGLSGLDRAGADGVGVDAGTELSGLDRAVLAVAARSWPSNGARDRAIRERLGMSPPRYHQLLNALLDDVRALRHDPVTVNRLRSARQARRDATR